MTGASITEPARSVNVTERMRSRAAADGIGKGLTRMIHDGSLRNRQDAKRDGHAESRKAEAYLKQYVEALRDEPVRLDVETGIQACRSGVSVVAVEAFMNHEGLNR